MANTAASASRSDLARYSALAPFFSQIFVGLRSFSEEYFTSDADNILARRWGDYYARIARYETFWAHFESNVYRSVHKWSDLYKSTYGIDAYTRSIYSPAFRIGEFWATHLMGGALDPDAGDGVERSSALPIVITREDDNSENADAVREGIAQVWRDSNWQARKETYTRFGAVCGDVALMIEDDVDREKVCIRPIHPRSLRYVERDSYGNVKGYIIQELRYDPRQPEVNLLNPILVMYAERCTRQGDSVVYQTYLNGEPYDWHDYPYETPEIDRNRWEWSEAYGFVPMVVVQHRDMGLGWGWSELHASISKLHELDDLASRLSDWIAKNVESAWFIAGVAPPGTNTPPTPGMPFVTNASNELIISGGPGDRDADRAGRDDGDGIDAGKNRLPTIYAPDPKATATPLVAPLNVADVSAHILTILKELERDHPELQADMATASGDASGRALRVARERVEAMVVQRRQNYDDALVRAQKMALSIGGQKGYPGYESFGEGAFEAGLLDHAIGQRPVFAVDEMDDLEVKQARANVLAVLVKSLMPIDVAMEQAGYAAEVVDAVKKSQEKAAKVAAEQLAAQQAHQVKMAARGAANGRQPIAGQPNGKQATATSTTTGDAASAVTADTAGGVTAGLGKTDGSTTELAGY